MVRGRLLTSLVFNVVLALWVLRDGRRRRARKPVFAAVLALLWGPLALGLWESDRPLRAGERRGTTPRAVAHGFLTGWIAMLPAVCVLALQAIEHRAEVPGSLGRQIGPLPATAVAVAMLWGGPALLAVVLGWWERRPGIGHEVPMATDASWPSWLAAAVAGAAALATALVVT